MLKRASVFFSVIIVMAFFCAVCALAAPPAGPAAENITVTNNLTGMPDTVTVSGVDATDIIRVYSASSGGSPIGAGFGTAVVYINQLGAGGGNVYVTVTVSEESARTQKAYGPEQRTNAPGDGDVTVQNNVAGNLDVITVTGVSNNDIVRVYQSAVGTAALSATVSSGSPTTLYVSQLGVNQGSVYITVQHAGEIESTRYKALFESETTAQLPADAVVVTNNFYKETSPTVQDPASRDVVTVTGAAAGDRINVYKTASGPDKWADDVPATGSPMDIYINKLDYTGGKLWVTVTKPGKAESKRVGYTVPPEDITPKLTTGQVKVTNNYGSTDDMVEVFSLVDGDIIRVYSAAAEIATGTVASGGNSVEITIDDLHFSASGGTFYVTRTTDNANESARLEVKYTKEKTANPPPKGDFTVTNAFGPNNDSIEARNLEVGNIIRIYGASKGGIPIGEVTAAAATEDIPLNPGALSYKGGTIYISIATGSSAESTRTSVTYSMELVATAPAVNNITVHNYYGTDDTVSVSGLAENDVIKVYDAAKVGTLLGTGTANAVGTAEANIVAGKLKQAGGTLYVTVTTSSANESPRTPKPYGIEPTTDVPALNNISVTNNFDMPDEVTVSGLAVDDIVNIYTNPSAAAVASVTADDVSETIQIPAGKLSAAAGKLYVSVKSSGKNASAKAIKPYESEKTSALVSSTVEVHNNYVGTNDTVTVTGLTAGDIVKVYKAAGGIDMWDSGTAAGASIAFDIPQLGQKAGKIFVTITKFHKAESIRAAVSYLSEPVTTALTVNKIKVENNYNTDDHVIISGIENGWTITLYTSATGTAALDTAVAADITHTFTLEDGLLAANGSKLFVSVKKPLELESVRTAVTYTSEITATPKAGNILVVNYSGTQYDTVTMIGLTAGDTVTVYDAATLGNALASETVTGKGTTITLETNLNDDAGKVWVTVTNEGKAESKRTAVAYYAA